MTERMNWPLLRFRDQKGALLWETRAMIAPRVGEIVVFPSGREVTVERVAHTFEDTGRVDQIVQVRVDG